MRLTPSYIISGPFTRIKKAGHLASDRDKTNRDFPIYMLWQSEQLCCSSFRILSRCRRALTAAFSSPLQVMARDASRFTNDSAIAKPIPHVASITTAINLMMNKPGISFPVKFMLTMSPHGDKYVFQKWLK